jgi:phosphoribosylamine---glycine ligase
MAKPVPCPNPCNVLLIGGGGREHALAWKLRQSALLGALWTTNPENAGLATLATRCDQAMDMKNTFLMRRWCEKHDIHLVVVGPELPLTLGIANALQGEARMVFGPVKEAAQLEGDKAFAKELMLHASIPCAAGRVFRNAEAAIAYLEARETPCVIKAAGLAAGKGVVVTKARSEAIDAVTRMMVRREFGAAGDTILIDEKLSGQEVSVLALVDGRTITVLDPCQDHKQVGEGDTGPNTGGMGAYCPTPVIDRDTMALVEREVLVPAVDALRRDGVEYRGVLYAGVMLTPAGPKVLEFNTRFGDPECQPLMMRLQGDLVEILWATCTGALGHVDISFDERVACCVVMCAAGYPGPYEKGKVISGIEDAESLSGPHGQVTVFHAGTMRDKQGNVVTNGGRVLGVTALADDLAAARDLANTACGRIHFDGAHFRRDIGGRALARV